MALRFGMVVLYARDLRKTIEFYRLLGLEIPDPPHDRPVAMYRLSDGVTLIITTDEIARRFDSDWTRSSGGYQQVVEFFVDDDAAVDDIWNTITAAGYRGRTAPGSLNGPYATVVEDPDGNVILITHE